MSQGETSRGEMSYGEKRRMGRNVAGRNVAGRNVAGRNVFWGETSHSLLKIIGESRKTFFGTFFFLSWNFDGAYQMLCQLFWLKYSQQPMVWSHMYKGTITLQKPADGNTRLTLCFTCIQQSCYWSPPKNSTTPN